MKKKVLFIIGSLQSGGVSKSMVSLLNAWDTEKYETSLLLCCKDGDVFSDYLPKNIQLGGQQLLYYMVNKLSATKKVSFFHSDYSKWPFYYNADRKYYPLVDHIFTISQTCVDSLKHFFPNCADRVSIMENISSPTIIRQQSLESIGEFKVQIEQMKAAGNTILCTIGHICRGKGFDFAIEASDILKRNGINFKWLFIGKVLEEDLLKLIADNKLDDNILLIGVQRNPYPYIGFSDIVVHPSRFEGKSIALDGTICEMSGKAVANAIIELINNPTLQDSYRTYLGTHIVDNSREVNKLYTYL